MAAPADRADRVHSHDTWQRGREIVTAERERREGSYFLSKIELRRGDEPTMAGWRKRLFIATSHITADAADHFGLPRDRTVTVGLHIDV